MFHGRTRRLAQQRHRYDQALRSHLHRQSEAAAREPSIDGQTAVRAAQEESPRAAPDPEETLDMPERPGATLDHGKNILEKFADLNVVSMLRAKILQIFQLPLYRLEQLLSARFIDENIEAFFAYAASKFEAAADRIEDPQALVDTTLADATKAAVSAFHDENTRIVHMIDIVLSETNRNHFLLLGQLCVSQKLLDGDAWKEFQMPSLLQRKLIDIKEAVKKTLLPSIPLALEGKANERKAWVIAMSQELNDGKSYTAAMVKELHEKIAEKAGGELKAWVIDAIHESNVGKSSINAMVEELHQKLTKKQVALQDDTGEDAKEQ